MNRRRVFYICLTILALFLVGTVVVLSSISYYLAIDPNAYLTELEVPSPGNGTHWNATDHSQRADAIRYFVLHHYGGVYMDLDIGCLRPVDPLLVYPVILPKTIPVGVSNDLMFAEKGHPFLEQTIHNLVTFDHSWILNYPTVMFSTGPMFLSAQYGLYTSSHPTTAVQDIRILPKSLYGKNAKKEEAPHSFFSHFYGSSWHADDAAFIGFLGTWGKFLMWAGLIVFVIGVVRLSGNKQRRYSLRRIGGYEVLLPRFSHHSGRWHLHLGGWSGSSSQPPSPDGDVPVLHLPFDDVEPASPSLSDASTLADPYAGRTASPIVEVFNRLRNRVASSMGTGGLEDAPRTPVRTRRLRPSRGVLFFLPAIFTQSQDIELAQTSLPRISSSNTMSRASQLPPEKVHFHADLESVGDLADIQHSDYVPSSRSSQDTTLVDFNDLPQHQRHSSSSSSSSHGGPSRSRNPQRR
ncbi:hypothetical protein C0993_000039 [Termitomyces sp. T159_Od127]|nr:hypothetical protein C0993_000039 [Termitomyces sp. T159_Od127]